MSIIYMQMQSFLQNFLGDKIFYKEVKEEDTMCSSAVIPTFLQQWYNTDLWKLHWFYLALYTRCGDRARGTFIKQMRMDFTSFSVLEILLWLMTVYPFVLEGQMQPWNAGRRGNP